MSPNQKLTTVLKGRSVASTEHADGTLTVHFQDATLLRIKGTAVSFGALSQGTKITQVVERGPALELHFEDGSPVSCTLGNPGNAVSVRDAAGKVLYLG